MQSVSAETTISDIEKTVQDGLEALRNAPLNNQITAALRFLTPQGYRPVAQLEEDGRKKRSTAASSNWSPATGEIVIYFERMQDSQPPAERPESPAKLSSAGITESYATFQREANTGKRHDPLLATPTERHLSTKRAVQQQFGDPIEPLVTDEQLRQLCSALADAEKVGRAFIAIKKFRDEELLTHGYSWTNSVAHRQAVLARAIDLGAVATSQIPNPKAPQYPTTTVKLNRESGYAKSIPPRFQPIKLRGTGPSASEVLIADRGRF